MEGRCQCGSIKFKTPLSAPLEIYICHCNECRHQSSSAFGVSAIFPAFEMQSPHPGGIGTYSRKAPSGRMLDCYFCAKCGSRLMHKSEGEDQCSVKGGCLEGPSLKGAIHIWCKEAIVDIPARAMAYDEEPPPPGGYGLRKEGPLSG